MTLGRPGEEMAVAERDLVDTVAAIDLAEVPEDLVVEARAEMEAALVHTAVAAADPVGMAAGPAAIRAEEGLVDIPEEYFADIPVADPVEILEAVLVLEIRAGTGQVAAKHRPVVRRTDHLPDRIRTRHPVRPPGPVDQTRMCR